MKSSILDKEPVQKVVSLLLEAEAAVGDSPTTCGYGSAASALKIIDAFDVPKFRYDPIKKLFHKYDMSFCVSILCVCLDFEYMIFVQGGSCKTEKFFIFCEMSLNYQVSYQSITWKH